MQVLTSFYTAQLTAYLTLTDSKFLVNNFQELLDRPHPPAKWLALKGSGFQAMLEVGSVSTCYYQRNPYKD